MAEEATTFPLSEPDQSTVVPPGLSAPTVADRLRPLPPTAERALVLPLPSIDTTLAVPIEAMRAYRRPDPVGDVVRCDVDTTRRLMRPKTVLQTLWTAGRLNGATHDDVERLTEEFADSAANLALSYTQRNQRELSIRQQASDADWDSDTAFLRAATDPILRSERLITEGHPLHPGAKLRQGFCSSEVVSYASEYDGVPEIRFVAVTNEYSSGVTTEGGLTLSERLYELVSGLRDAVADAVTDAGHDPESMTVLPVHPWQYRHELPERYGRELDRGVIVAIPDCALPAAATVSLRTLVPQGTKRSTPPHLKLSLGIQTTSSIRTITPQTVHNGPRITDVLDRVLDDGQFKSLRGLPETAGACFHDPGGPHTDGQSHDRAKHLSALVRHNPLKYVDDGKLPVTGAALLSRGPLEDRPLIDVLAPDGGPDMTASFLRRYAETIVPDALRLLVAYGIGLEAHLQNCIIVFDDGFPDEVFIRDYGGLRICRDRLAAASHSISLYPGSVTVSDEMRPAYDKLTYALFQNHLAEVIRFLVRQGTISESRCWEIVSAVVGETLENLRYDGIPATWIDDAAEVLFESTWEYKCLTRMRLTDKSHSYVHESVPNPLSRSSE
ncbi:IucA/IucC family protein [Haloarcula argentinensis]|uniref:IucA/IucC family protein n=1 Tax=Haloarcula argentinensis TaxID=43776 RepID=UPI0019553F68|nr:IucA/IucC family protein [Haloarcula argentinensis]